jgi:hypothetical protein
MFLMHLNEKSKLDDVLKVLKDDLGGDDDHDGYIYSQALLKKLTYANEPLEIRFIDITGIGFYSLTMAGASVENMFSGLMALHCNYSINFDYFTQVMSSISDVASNAYVIKKPFKEINLTGLNWQDAYIRYTRTDNPSHSHSFNINGAHTIFNNNKISYDVDPSLMYESSMFNGCIGYFDAGDRENSCSGFVMRMQCSCQSLTDKTFANYSFFVSLDEGNPFILMEDGKVVTEERFKLYVEQHVYKLLHRAFSLTGVGPGTVTELKTFTPTEMKDLVNIHEMVKM